MNINSKTGMAVYYGIAIAFEIGVNESDTPTYVYFE